MNRKSQDDRSPSATPAVPRLQRRTLRQLTVVELSRVAAGRRNTLGDCTTAIVNECLTRTLEP